MKLFVTIAFALTAGCASSSMHVATAKRGGAWIASSQAGTESIWRCKVVHHKPVCFKAELVDDFEAWHKRVEAAHKGMSARPGHGAHDGHKPRDAKRFHDKMMRWHHKGDPHHAEGDLHPNPYAHEKVIIKRIDRDGNGEEEITIVDRDGNTRVIKKKIDKGGDEADPSEKKK